MKKTIKKAQVGVKQTVSKKKPVTDMQRDEMGRPVTPKQKAESLKGLQESVDYKGRPKGKKGIKVAKKGASFPDLNKDGKITKADILKGRGVIAKKGKKVAAKKMMGGGKCKYGCK